MVMYLTKYGKGANMLPFNSAVTLHVAGLREAQALLRLPPPDIPGGGADVYFVSDKLRLMVSHVRVDLGPVEVPK